VVMCWSCVGHVFVSCVEVAMRSFCVGSALVIVGNVSAML
jgi:hypothetical protein